MSVDPMTDALTQERLEAEWVFAKGTIKSIELEGGGGSISADEGDDDLPFRLTSVARGVCGLALGLRVEFVVDEGAHGLEAFYVAPLDAGRPAQH